ncbi:hypothetical protein [Anaerosalibacter massiliensis]|uniref:hypothetical protein n=1 Tax=Anaerosalibacter massiliensis TaxID=1347392 RepID=UPI0005B27B49|nr:hypothetical protein [Anaerosalibacter massiliensis]
MYLKIDEVKKLYQIMNDIEKGVVNKKDIANIKSRLKQEIEKNEKQVQRMKKIELDKIFW